MTTYQFHTVDVFTERAFGGNQLAVFPAAEGLTDAQMQLVAREINFSETTFVFAPEEAANTCKVRIFTPGGELPFAGHPTLGTAHVLAGAGQGRLVGEGRELILEEGVGPVPVLVNDKGLGRTHGQFSAAQMPKFGPEPPSRAALASILSITPDDIADDAPVQAVSCGVPYLFLPIRGLNAMARLKVNTLAWEQVLGGFWADAVFAWTRETVHGASDIHGRMFAPGIGITEDPATGSAVAALAGYLGAQEAGELKAGAKGTLRWMVEQGLEMGRPSFLAVETDIDQGEFTAVRVAGDTVSVSRGEMDVPDEEGAR